jgi:tungstate transport system permease protein
MLDGAALVSGAWSALARGDPDLWSAVAVSLRVSLTATVLAFLIGAPLGGLLAIREFRSRKGVLILVNALLGLPPVVVGLAVYLLLSRSGPLGALGLLFTAKAMILAQLVLTLPIVIALSHRTAHALWRDYGDALRIDGASTLHCIGTLLLMNVPALATTFLAAFGRAIAEVGAIMIVGGNIRGHTRTMTTSIALETAKGDLSLALGLGAILIAITVLVSALAFALSERQGEG